MGDENAAAVEALAESWASIDGKLERFRHCKRDPRAEDDHATYAGYMLDAAELRERLRARGFEVVPVQPGDPRTDVGQACISRDNGDACRNAECKPCRQRETAAARMLAEATKSLTAAVEACFQADLRPSLCLCVRDPSSGEPVFQTIEIVPPPPKPPSAMTIPELETEITRLQEELFRRVGGGQQEGETGPAWDEAEGKPVDRSEVTL